MNNNKTTSGREYHLNDDDILISKTDTRGNILYANSRFIEASGFSKDELIGSPHNLVRHPEMPADVFKDFWDTLKSGNTWKGIIKNRRKNGDYYWVQANVVPVKDGERTVGYASVRTKASSEMIRKADNAYRKIIERPGAFNIKQGTITPKNNVLKALSFNPKSITTRLVFSGVVAGALSASMLGGSILISNESRESINTINHSYIEMMGDLYDLEKQVTSNRRKINLSLNKQDGTINGDSLSSFKDEINETLMSWEKIKEEHLKMHSKSDLPKMDDLFLSVIDEGIISSAESISRGNYSEARSQFSKVLSTKASQLDQLLQEEILNAKDLASETSEKAIEVQNRHLLYLMAFALFGMLIITLIFVKIINGIRKPLQQTKLFSLQVAAGNLDSESPIADNNEIGHIVNNMNLMRQSLTSLVKEISKSVDSVVPAIDSILDNNSSMASRIEQQAAAVQETAASMEEISSIIRNSAENAESASSVSLENVQKVVEAEEIIGEMKIAMEEIRKQGQSMEEMIKVIDGIAFQTNILALNASVEAARAGEHGRGFSVVAQEVRNLASKSAEAAKEVQASIESTIKSVESGVAYSSRTGEMMNEISTSSGKVNDLMSEISASAKEQEHGVSQIGQAISEIDRATQESSYAMNEYAESTLSLKTETEQLENGALAFHTGRIKQRNVESPSEYHKRTYTKPSGQASAAGEVEPEQNDWSEF